MDSCQPIARKENWPPAGHVPGLPDLKPRANTTSALLMEALLSPKRRGTAPPTRRGSFHSMVSPRKSTSPRTPRATLDDVEAVAKDVPDFLGTRNYPWQVDQLLSRLREVVTEYQEDETVDVDSVVTALGRELCLLKCGGYIGITLHGLNEPVTLLAPAERMVPESITWQMKELRNLVYYSKKKIKSARLKNQKWTTIYFLGTPYHIQRHKAFTLCDHLVLARAEGAITLTPIDHPQLFEIRYDAVVADKALVVHPIEARIPRHSWRGGSALPLLVAKCLVNV